MWNWKKIWNAWRSPQTVRLPWRRQTQKGLTLIELLVSSVLISVVMLIAWSGLISLMNMSAVSEAKGLREIEVNKALDFLSAEIRTARNVNATATGELNASTSLETLLQNDGFDLNRLGNYGDLVLYLEIPSASTPPAICPAGGPNAGSPPPTPSDYDQVIYDVRDSPSEWLSPKVTMRYGRIKDDNGVFNPCENPVGSDPVADALSDDVANVPTCPVPGVLTGGPGFYACQEQEQTNLLLQNKLVDDSVQQTSMVSTPRLETIQPTKVVDVGCHREANLRTLNSDSNPIPYIFFNRRSTAVNLYWLDGTGTRQYYATIPSNGQFGEGALKGVTYLTHPWVVTDLNDACLQVAVPESDDSTFSVVIPPESLAGGANIPPTPQPGPPIMIEPAPIDPIAPSDPEYIPLGPDYIVPFEPSIDGADGADGLDAIYLPIWRDR